MHAQQVLKGFQGRKRNGVVMVCASCKGGSGAGGKAYEDHQNGMMIACVVFFALAIVIGLVMVQLRGR
jgi:hypothetical protein